MSKSCRLRKNEMGRWMLGDIEMTSGNLLEISLDGHWLRGVVEYQDGHYDWFSLVEGVHVHLRPGVLARMPTKEFSGV